jgi:hypothetical protein
VDNFVGKISSVVDTSKPVTVSIDAKSIATKVQQLYVDYFGARERRAQTEADLAAAFIKAEADLAAAEAAKADAEALANAKKKADAALALAQRLADIEKARTSVTIAFKTTMDVNDAYNAQLAENFAARTAQVIGTTAEVDLFYMSVNLKSTISVISQYFILHDDSIIARGDGAGVPAPATNKVKAPDVFVLDTRLTFGFTDVADASVNIDLPIKLYAPGEEGSLVAVSTDQYRDFGKASSSAPVFSRDGQVMSFLTSDQNFGISGGSGSNQIMRYTGSVSTIDLMSQSTFMGSLGSNAAYGNSLSPAISADGKVLAFASDAINIYPFYPAPKGRQIYLMPADTELNAFTSSSPVPLALNGFAPVGSMDKPALNGNGTIIAFESTYAFVSSVSNGAKQIYVKNITTGAYALASSDESGNAGNADSSNASISDDGRFVLFETDATNLGGNPNVRQIYSKDMKTGAVTLVSAGTNGQPGNAISTNAKLSGIVPYSGTGLSAAFESDATNLVSAAVSGRQVYRRDVTAKTTSLISVNISGQAAGGSNAGISGDGRFVVFKSAGAIIAGSKPSAAAQIYVYDAFANKAALVSNGIDGLVGNAASDTPTISADGRSIGFASLANNLYGTATNGVSQAYIAANPLTAPLANGFWINPNLPGQYYAVEQSGNKVWFAAFGYNSDTTPNWAFAAENALTSNGFTGSLLQTANGPVLAGTGGPATIANNLGSTSLAVAGQTSASLSLQTGTSTIQRNDFVTGGSSAGQVAGYPETGWWYAPSTNQSFFLEVQGTTLFAVIPSYAPTGRPTWYQTKGDMSSASAYSGALNACTGGASPACTTSAGTVALAFTSTLAGIITLPNGTKLPMQRWRF